MLGIVEYGAGNQTSVMRALKNLGIPALVTANAEELASCYGIIFPGVGSAGQAMANLRSSGLDQTLCNLVAWGKPLLGICLGCQIMLEESEEDKQQTLGLLPGRSIRFQAGMPDGIGGRTRIPHMGWNSLAVKKESPLLQGISENSEFYFVHSYHVLVPDDLIIATSSHGKEFCAIHGRNGLWGVQFHPEKSGRPGLQILRNFYAFCQEC